MWPDRRLLELFEIEHPIVPAPMAGLPKTWVTTSGRMGCPGAATFSAPFLVVDYDHAPHRSAGEHDLAGRSWLKNLLVRARRIGKWQYLANSGP
jgi:hypothetical protein